MREIGLPIVFKADGLAAGKGVLVCHRADEVEAAMVRFFEERAFGAAGERVLVEQGLSGEETSFMVLTDGATVVPLASARDYKRLEDGDRGPNTGGMGSVSPAPLPSEVAAAILRDIVHPTIDRHGPGGPAVSWGAVRRRHAHRRRTAVARVQLPARRPRDPGGDPPPRRRPPATPAGGGAGELAGMRAAWKREACACVVLAADGYPGSPRRGDQITGLAEALALEGVLVFQAGTALEEGRLVTAGGRVLSVVGRGATVAEAARTAYEGASRVQFAGVQFRRDVGEAIP